MKNDTKKELWKILKQAAAEFTLPPIAQHPEFHSNQKRLLSSDNITLDYTHQRLNKRVLSVLYALAKTCQIKENIDALFTGELVNYTEQKPALHTALRADASEAIFVNEQAIMPKVDACRQHIAALSDAIRHQQWLGYSQKPITDIVHIGIGGSDLGPRFCFKALSEYRLTPLNFHFISDAAPGRFNATVNGLSPETTLFIIASKSFTTDETIANAKKAMQWLGASHYSQQMIAVTACAEKAQAWGIKHILPIWDWVGGRFSFCSAMNLINAIAVGYERFEELLKGAQAMDTHVKTAPLEKNLPLLMALLGIWNNNFLGIHHLLTLTYTHQLDEFVPYIQQLEMESNGKSINREGKPVSYATAPLIWGGPGTQAQHSYYQLLCQGTHTLSMDLITNDALNGTAINDSCLHKINVLTKGIPYTNNPYQFVGGNIPLNHLILKDSSPFTIGALVALYEHKVFIQSIIWEVNAFDQPGVEWAKAYHAAKKHELSGVI